MKGLTVTVSESNWKIVLDWGMKGMSNIDLSQVPNVFGIRDFIASKLGAKQGIFSRVRNALWKGIHAIASWLSPKEKEDSPITAKETPKTPAESVPNVASIPFYDFTKDDLGIKSATPPSQAGQAYPLPKPETQHEQTKILQTA